MTVGNDHALTLDELFRRAVLREPERAALVDPFNGAGIGGNAPSVLTFAQADQAISALAARLRGLGLQTGAVVAIQLPNCIESVIALLGVLRAGLIAAPLPPPWRRPEIVMALAPIGARAIIGAAAQAEPLLQAAAELFPVRYVCGFGANPPDGMVPLDAIFTADSDASEAAERRGADRLAVVTFDVTADGIVAVARNHRALIAGADEVMRAGLLAEGGNMLSTIVPGSFATIALTLVPWLSTGGTLALHQPFDLGSFFAQCRALSPCSVAVPGPLLPPLAEAGLAAMPIDTILALWRTPDLINGAPDWPGATPVTDVAAFGEVGLYAARRGADAVEPSALDTAVSDAGTLMLRGPMVPVQSFPLGTELGDKPYLAADAAGFVDTGFPCRIDNDRLVIAGARPAPAAYRSALEKLEAGAVAAA